MSMVGTLAKLAVGAMVAKGVGSVVRNGGIGGGGGSAGGLGGLLGGLGGALGGNQAGGLAGGQQNQGGGLGGGAGGGLGGLGALLGGAAGGNQASGGAAGGLGGLLESIGGGANQPSNAQAPAGGSLGHLLNDELSGEDGSAATAEQEDQARILITAMIAGTKADGNIDQAEQQKIVEHLGNDISPEERTFVLNEMKSDLDVDALISSIPKGSEQQAYMMSLMGMTLDNKEEAVFLDTFRKGLQVSEEQANAIHQQLGVPTLYG